MPNPLRNQIAKLAAEAKSASKAVSGVEVPGDLPPVGASAPAIAGYLPAPAEPRFISSAEEAAKKLPPSIKAESLKNALIKGGAKPVELEYAGLDQFAASRKGQRVPSGDVLRHLQQEGPLGRMGRVDQRSAWVSSGGWSVEGPLPPDDQVPPLANIRRPFDEGAAYANTQYEEYTEQGKRGDHSGYREVLFADPRNPGRGGVREMENAVPLEGDTSPPGPPFTMQNAGRPVNAHDSDYWIRYHSNPNEIAVQNIQSDIGQRISKEASERPSELRALNQRLEELYALEDRYLALPDDNPDKADSLKELSETISDAVDFGTDGFRGTRGADGRWRFSAYAPDPASPISRDDKWKDFLVRQIVLEAAAQGKPITLPTAVNANAVENMPTPAAAAFYERDIPDRIRKLLKEFDPQGGGGSTTFVPDVPDGRAEITSGPKPYTLHYGLTNARGKAVITPDVSAAMRRLLNVYPPYVPDRLNAPEYAAAMTRQQDDLWEAARSGGLSAAQIEDARNLGVLYGLLERSPARPPVRQRRGPAADAPRPGTHIQMTPIARRNILERGMPILSVGGLLGGLTSRNENQR